MLPLSPMELYVEHCWSWPDPGQIPAHPIGIESEGFGNLDRISGRAKLRQPSRSCSGKESFLKRPCYVEVQLSWSWDSRAAHSGTDFLPLT